VSNKRGAAVFVLPSMEAETFTIGELAAEFGITARALRFYEEEGLISPRRDGAARIYSQADRARVAWIVRGKNVGFSLDEIGDLLRLYDAEPDRQKRRAATADLCRARAEALRSQIAALEGTLTQLSRFAANLDELL